MTCHAAFVRSTVIMISLLFSHQFLESKGLSKRKREAVIYFRDKIANSFRATASSAATAPLLASSANQIRKVASALDIVMVRAHVCLHYEEGEGQDIFVFAVFKINYSGLMSIYGLRST